MSGNPYVKGKSKSREEIFPQSLMMASGPRWFTNGASVLLMKLYMPEDLHTVKNLYLHFVISVDTGTTTAPNRHAGGIYVQSDPSASPGVIKGYDITVPMNADDEIEKKIDLSAVIANSEGDNWVKVVIPTGLDGRVELFKLDALITTVGIR